MRVGQVVYMNVVTNTGAIGRGIVGAEQFQLSPFASHGF